MELSGVEPKELTRLHGKLLACGWLEQNTGMVTVFQPEACLRSYRTTAAGRRALHRAQAGQDEDLEAA